MNPSTKDHTRSMPPRIHPCRERRIYASAADLIASPADPTPIVHLARLSPPQLQMYLKLEWFNPFGSIKDRIARRMLAEAGPLEGRTVIEASSGNTGIALAALANIAGIPIDIAIPERAPEEKKNLLRLLGARIWEASDDLCPRFPHEGARGLAKALHESPQRRNSIYTNQYENELNLRTHYEETGPEIWQQTGGNLDYFVAGLGTTGTVSGVGRFLKERRPEIKVIAVEPASPNHNLPGLKNLSQLDPSLTPAIFDPKVVDRTVAVSDEAAYRTVVELAEREGLLTGPSTGAAVRAALDLAEEGAEGIALVISPNNAFKYISSLAPYLAGRGSPTL